MKSTGDTQVKHCGRCKETLPIAEFVVNTARGDGLSGYCRACMNEVNQESRRDLRTRVENHLGGRCCNPNCAVPGGMKDPRALQIDHIEGNGREDRLLVGQADNFLRAVLKAPPGKYQLLCANCNSIRRVELKQVKGKRVYERTIPTERILLREDPTWKQEFGDKVRQRWADAGPEALAERNGKISESRTGKGKKLTDEQEAEALKLMRNGMTQTAAAEKFEVSGAFMSKLAKRHGLAFRRGRAAIITNFNSEQQS